jgi:prepilin-type N-terminal cleavage/methylation domain-containing protein
MKRWVKSRTRGLGLIELLVSLAISAALLTATAVALDASFKAYGANQEQATLSQRARITLNRILTYIRICDAHQPHASAARANFVTGAIVTDTGIDMLKDDGTAISFVYDSTAQQLSFTQGASTAVLLNGVTSFSIQMEPMKSADNARSGGNYDLLMRATVLITLRTTADTTGKGEGVGQQTLTLSSSVMPRRNVW